MEATTPNTGRGPHGGHLGAGTTMHKDRSGPLVRAGAITHLMANTEKLTVHWSALKQP